MPKTSEQRSGNYQIPREQTSITELVRASGYLVDETGVGMICVRTELTNDRMLPGGMSIGLIKHPEKGIAYINYKSDSLVLLEEAVRLKELFDLNRVPYTEAPTSEEIASRLENITRRLTRSYK